MNRVRAMGKLVGLALLAAGGVGCQQDEKVVRYKPFFSGLDNVETRTPAVQERGPMEVGEAGEGDSLVVVNPDGSKRLISKTGVQLMAHIRWTLEENEAELFVNQVMSKVTREEYYQRGLDPREGFAKLKEHERDILQLFAQMPMGEHSPNVRMDALGKNTFRVRLTGRSTVMVGRYTGFDMVLEDGHWRLRWFV